MSGTRKLITSQIIGIRFWAWVKTKQDASWWINHKNMTVKGIAKEWKQENNYVNVDN